MKFRTLIFTALLVGAASIAGAVETFNVDGRHSEATFRIRHLVGKVSGKFADVSGAVNLDRANPAVSTVEFSIKSASVDTGVADRDKHLRSADFFDVEKYPEITFKSTKVAPSGKKDIYNVTGDFTMHGVTKQVTLPVEFLGFGKDPGGNERAGFTLSTTLDRKEYGIVWNRAIDQGGALLGDDVDINVVVEAVKKKEAAAAPTAK
jgi:polyisoprenoid-binding protein YceI